MCSLAASSRDGIAGLGVGSGSTRRRFLGCAHQPQQHSETQNLFILS